MERFILYTEKQLDKVEPTLNRVALRDIFLRIYANPIVSKEQMANEKSDQ